MSGRKVSSPDWKDVEGRIQLKQQEGKQKGDRVVFESFISLFTTKASIFRDWFGEIEGKSFVSTRIFT